MELMGQMMADMDGANVVDGVERMDGSRWGCPVGCGLASGGKERKPREGKEKTTAEEIPARDEIPASDETPVMEEIPRRDEIPASEEIPVREEIPARKEN
ncbi:unnamed protein product [Calypogeia fissa]